MILYFSGTGNSEYAAEVIASVTGDALHDMTPDLQVRKAPALHSETPWVIAAPTYAWRLPLLVESWLRGAMRSSRSTSAGQLMNASTMLDFFCRIIFDR